MTANLLIPPHRVIAAWGDSDTVSYHGDNRARSSIRFFGPDVDDKTAFQDAMASEAEGSFEFRAVDHPIKQVVTEYADFCFTNSDLIQMGMPADTGLHMIGFEPIIDEDAKAHVHHFILYGSSDTNEDANSSERSCKRMKAYEMINGWAPGRRCVCSPRKCRCTSWTGWISVAYDWRFTTTMPTCHQVCLIAVEFVCTIRAKNVNMIWECCS